MEQDDDQNDEQDAKLEARKAALELRRARLRDLADSILDITETMEKPKTWLEAGRATRTIGAMDRIMVRLYSEPDLRCVTAMERAQKELEDRILRYIKKNNPENDYASFPDERPAKDAPHPAPVWTDNDFAGSSVFGRPKSDMPNSYTSGDATPAPELAKPAPPMRSGPSIRSLAPDWPPWPPR